MDATLTSIPITGYAVAAQPGLFGRRRWRLWVLSAEAALVCIGVALWHWPLLTVWKVAVEAPSDWGNGAEALAVLPADGNLFHVDPLQTRDRLAAQYADRASVDARITLPNTLSIRVVPTPPELWTDPYGSASRTGIAVDGSLLSDPLDCPVLPTWKPPICAKGHLTFTERAKTAAAAWAEVSAADTRYPRAVSAWTSDPSVGWTMTGVDRKTQIVVGRVALGEHARAAARLLDETDTLLAQPCLIDARFDGYLSVHRLSESVPDSVSHLDSTRGPIKLPPTPVRPSKPHKSAKRAA
ncbi:MAG: hypothetical protein HY304_02445 [candidate division Zixibacteria bacterium]|nr:hypothetical protein [candidate division Zixibacteria bacterium]